VLQTLSAFEAVQRYLDPNFVPQLAKMVAPLKPDLEAAREAFNSLDWPPDHGPVRDQLDTAARYTAETLSSFLEKSGDPTAIIPLYRAVRRSLRALESLYPLFPVLRLVNSFFLEESLRESEPMLNRLVEPFRAPHGQTSVGLFVSENDRRQRGGYSLYVPEYYDGSGPWPLVVALHGGSGHGADFLWLWLREARSRGFLLLAPTSYGSTWSLIEEAVDGRPLRDLVERIGQAYSVDRERILLTGMSDGGTFALLAGLQEHALFTHLAPISCVLHPMILADGSIARAAGKPIYLVHGALDWMFPIAVAREGRNQLSAAGAKITFREIPDLSHTYPRDENARILDWFGVPLQSG
jgi:phospholipase/carboxylesterase